MCNNLAQRYNKNNHKARKRQEILHLLHIFLHRFRVASGREMPYTYHTHTIHIPYTCHTHAIPLSMATVWYHRENTEASPLVAILVAYSYSLFEYVYSLGRTWQVLACIMSKGQHVKIDFYPRKFNFHKPCYPFLLGGLGEIVFFAPSVNKLFAYEERNNDSCTDVHSGFRL